MQELDEKDKFNLNPNPITKLIAVLFFSFSLSAVRDEWTLIALVIAFSIFYFLLGKYKDGIKNLVFYAVLFFIVYLARLETIPAFLNMFVVVVIIIKAFYLPFMAGAFLIKTSDVGSIVTSMDKLHISKNLSIPIATMFRFGPSFRQEYKNIRFAMKMRGISLKNPLLALEYIYVPLLAIASEIAEDIAKYAETKALSDPCKKVRITKISFGTIDFLFSATLITILFLGKL